jgi:hypothetical protein
MPADIVTGILFKLQDLFTQDLITAVPLDDPLRANSILLGPLQQDPTEIGPFVLISLDKEKGRELRDPKIYAEIGGHTTFWKLYFIISGWVNTQTTKETNYSVGGAFADRVLHVLLNRFQLDGLSTDDSRESVTGCNLDMIDRMTLDPIGGEDTWYLKYNYHIHYYTERSDL